MSMFNILIVDDEPIARDIIKNFCAHLPFLQLVADCGNALQAKKILEQQPVDILFLDIHMPVLDGIGFLKTMKQKPQVIFTTAYKEYAVNAFDLAACDYLVKPFLLERFIIAVDKAVEKIKASNKSSAENNGSADHLFIKADGRIYKLLYNEILFAEAMGNYTKIVTINATILPNISFVGLEELLPVGLFARVHRSFIINTAMITHIEGNTVCIQKSKIPIGGNYKESFLKNLGL